MLEARSMNNIKIFRLYFVTTTNVNRRIISITGKTFNNCKVSQHNFYQRGLP